MKVLCKPYYAVENLLAPHKLYWYLRFTFRDQFAVNYTVLLLGANTKRQSLLYIY